MIKLLRAEPRSGHAVRLEFSDGSVRVVDLAFLLEHDTELTRPLRGEAYFRSFFLECGALCWPNGLELSPGSLWRRLEAGEAVEVPERVA